MNRQHLWKIAPLCLLITSMALYVCAQEAAEEPATSIEAPAVVEAAKTETTNAVRRSTRDASSDDNPFDDKKTQKSSGRGRGRIGASSNAQGGYGQPRGYDEEQGAYGDYTTEFGAGGYGGGGSRFAGGQANPTRQLDQQSQIIVQAYKKNGLTDKQRESVQTELQKVVIKQFDLLQKARESELLKLKKELDRLLDLHNRRQDQKGRIVGDRVQSLLREADGLGWGSTSSSRRGSSRFGGPSAFSSQTSDTQLSAPILLNQPPVATPTLNIAAPVEGAGEE